MLYIIRRRPPVGSTIEPVRIRRTGVAERGTRLVGVVDETRPGVGSAETQAARISLLVPQQARVVARVSERRSLNHDVAELREWAVPLGLAGGPEYRRVNLVQRDVGAGELVGQVSEEGYLNNGISPYLSLDSEVELMRIACPPGKGSRNTDPPTVRVVDGS